MRKGQKVIDMDLGLEVVIEDFLDGGHYIVKEPLKRQLYSQHESKLVPVQQVQAKRPWITPPPINWGESVQTPRVGAFGGTSTPVPQNKTNQIGGVKMNIKRLFGEFGKVQAGEVALTFDGKVVIKRNAEEYVRYNAEKEVIENHMGMILEQASKLFYILPVQEVAEGDVIKDKGAFYQVLKVNENKSLLAINLAKGTKSTICKETNAFGFNFYYKVTSLFQDGTNTTTAGINPMMLMMLGEKGETDDLLPLLLMGGLGATGSAGQMNPLLMMSLLGDKGGSGMDIKDMLMMQAFSGGAGFGTTGEGGFNPLLFALMK